MQFVLNISRLFAATILKCGYFRLRVSNYHIFG